MLERLLQSPLPQQLLDSARSAGGAAAYALCEGGRAALTAALAKKAGCPVLYVAPGAREAARIAEDINQFLPGSAAAFRSRERQFVRAIASREAEWQRLSALDGVRTGRIRVLCVPADALLWRMTPPELYDALTVSCSVGDTQQPAQLISRLTEAGYERVDMVEGPGQCALRGDILDVFPPSAQSALRLEFFGDEIDGIRAFDCISQRSIRHMDSVRIPPAGEYLMRREDRPAAGERMRALLEEALRNRKEALPASRIAQTEMPDAEQAYQSRDGLGRLLREADTLAEGGMCRCMDLWAGLLMPRTCTLTEWLQDVLVVADTPDRCRSRMDDSLQAYYSDLEQAVASLDGIAAQQDLLLHTEEALSLVNGCPLITLQDFLRGTAGFRQGTPVKIDCLSAPQYHGSIRDLAADLNTWMRQGEECCILCGGEARGERLRGILGEMGCILDRERIKPLSLSRGFTWPALGLHILSESDVYGTGHKKARQAKTSGQRIEAFTDLKEGDYVVHEMHGVGIYRGVTRVQSEGVWRDYLLIQYRDSDKLYVPTDQFDRVQKYIGSADTPPPINSLSGGEWSRQKSRVRAGLKKLAFSLVRLYAERESTPGHAFAPDGPWAMQFGEGVPYELTPDQVRAVEDITRDMEAPRNMDRLLCGDVGYGKTEVALRAAFKAVSDGKQVAFLAPTTILAQQHYYTCRKRFQDFPVNIDVVSRFRSPAVIREALQKTAAGKTDILIGTHRLLSRDVQFKDLGLLIVDEEQRFGVAHKEAIKNIKKKVDVLTLSATPIPRTLHMSMVGVRDMSLLETPPEERIPVQTYVMDFNESVVRSAILREMERGGQVYFLYNRVANIDSFAGYLRQLVPQARIAVGHGQMREHALEDVMLDFYAGRYDVLLCSTIIENGLDVPAANTIIVYDADRFGLSQLYQLRGRVGRSNRVAYAYFTVRPDKMLTENAEKRLSAIREFTQFGAGFRIAMRDLEIRGAGDIFGAEQSGHISTVGYDMYCKLIEEAVREARGDAPLPDELEPRVDLKADAFLPDDYVRGSTQRVEIYRRISMLRSMEDRSDIIDELIDRFGEIPEPVMALLDVALIRACCLKLGVDSVRRQGDQVFMRFDMRFLPDLNRLNLALDGSDLRFSASRVAGLVLPLRKGQKDQDALKVICAQMNAVSERLTEVPGETPAAGS
ncbi:MAG: transcription-repair coupling factor [Clostridia bacterium]|nr:transcription-repair coupling factor [Clostridia bacterium]